MLMDMHSPPTPFFSFFVIWFTMWSNVSNGQAQRKLDMSECNLSIPELSMHKFDTVTRSCSPATAIRQNCTFSTSQSSAVLCLPRDWTIHRGKVLRLPWKNDPTTLARATQNASATFHAPKHNISTVSAICGEIYLAHCIRETLFEHRP